MREEDIIKLSREALDADVEQLDAATLSRLNRARHNALESAGSSRWISLGGVAAWKNWLPAGALAGAAMLALAIALPGTAPVNQGGTDLSLPLLVEETSLAAFEDKELLEDLDMMLWLVDVENHAS